MFIMKYLVLMMILVFSTIQGKTRSSIGKTYQKGFEAYGGERWSECIAQFEESMHLYKLYNSVINNCGLKCKSQQSESQIHANFDDLKMYEGFLNEKHCLISCREKQFQQVNLKSDEKESILSQLKERKPYQFLHICYFQMYMLPKAASAAYTYLLAHPDDDVMKHNLKYYTQQPEVNVNEVMDFESEDFEVLHKVGLQSYDNKDWGETIVAMEEVLTDFFAWDRACRVACEHLPKQKWSPEFVITISNNIVALLQCRQQCQRKLSAIGYESGAEFLADTLNHLQISYYHSKRYEDAAINVASYLAIFPDDEDMLLNKNIYSSLVDDTAFTERSDIVYYFKRDQYEKELLSYFSNTNNNDFSSNSVES